MKKLILAIDFDNTIVNSDFPTVLDIKPGAQEFIKRLHDDGHLIMINTCRGKLADMLARGADKEFAKEASQEEVATYLWKMGIPFHGINIQPYPVASEFKYPTRKMYADVYIDDKSLHTLAGASFDWDTIYQIVTRIANEAN